MKPASVVNSTPRYRRSKLTKAPRKRTFIANMTKTSIPVFVPLPALPRSCITPVESNGDGNDGFNGGVGGGRYGNGGGGAPFPGSGASGEPMLPLTSFATLGVAAALVLAVLSPASAAHAATAAAAPRTSAGYFAVAGFSQPPRKISRRVVDAIPYGVVDLDTKERRMVNGSLQQLNAVERMHV